MIRSMIAAALFALLAPAALAGGRPILSVEGKGGRALRSDEVARIAGLEKGGTWSVGAESLAAEKLLRAYARRGYLDAEVLFRAYGDVEGPVRIEIAVDEGDPVPLTALEIAGVEAFPKGEILSRFDTGPGKILDGGRLRADLERLLRRYARSGRPTARALLAGLSRGDGGAFGLKIRVVEGPLLRLGALRVTGNARTRLATIRRLSGLRFGGPYDQDAVDASRRRLLRSGLFRTISEPAVRVDWKKKEATVEVAVEEGRMNRIAGLVGYAPGREGEKGIVSGFVDVEFRNILGTARRGGARWARPSPESREARLFYREPWLFGSPFSLGGELEQTLRDSTFARVTASLATDLDLSRRVSASFSAGLETMKPRGDETNIPRSTRRWGRAGLLFDGRDLPANPHGGGLLRLGAEYGERRIEEEGDRGIEGERVRQAVFDASAGLYRSLGRRTVLAGEASGIGRLTDAAYVPAYDQFYLGGARTLRGYEEDRFRGSRLAWSRIEYRYLLGALSRVFLFYDTGYIFSRREEEGEIVRSESVKSGYGFGIRFDSAIGLLGIDYGLGEGDPLGGGKLHVSAEGDF